MRSMSVFRMVSLASLSAALCLLPAQDPGPAQPAPQTPSPSPSPSPPPASGSIPGPGPTTPGRDPFPTDRGRQPRTPSERDTRDTFPQEMPRPIFISGKVMLQDGTPPPDSVVIERVCNGLARPEGYTDSKGQIGRAHV